jgi:hypothetical protein
MARRFEDFRGAQDECKITIIRGGETLTMTTKQYKNMIRAEKAKATRAKNLAEKKAKEAEEKAYKIAS